MKNTLLLLVLVVFVFACKNKTESTETTTPVSTTATTFTYSAAFTASVQQTMTAYFQLKDAFVADDTAAVNKSGAQLKSLLDSLKLNEVEQKDSLGYQSINGRPGDVVAEITGMLGEADIDQKRESFEMISNAFYDMLRVIKPAGNTYYYQYCPMAFDKKGAYWLSNVDSIQNPYFGKKMLDCGETKETLKY